MPTYKDGQMATVWPLIPQLKENYDKVNWKR